ncbi:MAG: HAD hydrolase-like protein, partial [Polaribacter sp.]|nr:HAD hydrolase-like protein [Polaribacter sp.]
MKYVIFDIDGTLTDTTKVDDKCYIESYESLFKVSIKGVKWSEIKNVTDWGITEELVEDKLNRTVTKEDILNLKKLFLSKLKHEFIVDKSKFAEIRGALKFYQSLLKESEYEIGIATGGWEETANFKLDTIGINPHEVAYSNSNKFKNREHITLDVIEQLNAISSVKPNEIIYFGDGKWDFETCKNLGIRFIGIDNNNNRKLEGYGAKEVYNNFESYEIIVNSIKN